MALKVGDIDSNRMTLRIEQGKNRKDRYAMLSLVLLERLLHRPMTNRASLDWRPCVVQRP